MKQSIQRLYSSSRTPSDSLHEDCKWRQVVVQKTSLPAILSFLLPLSKWPNSLIVRKEPSAGTCRSELEKTKEYKV